MAQWQPDRYVDEHYDEWCPRCDSDTEHSMGICLECANPPPTANHTQIKKKKTAVQKAK